VVRGKNASIGGLAQLKKWYQYFSMNKKLLLVVAVGFVVLLGACVKGKGQTTLAVKGGDVPAAGLSESAGTEKTPVNFTAPAKPEGVAQIYVRRNTDGTDAGFQALVDLMGEHGEPFYATDTAPNGIVGSADVIVLFFNCQWSERGGTNTDVINAVVEAIAKHPAGFTGEIIIADNGQGRGSLDHSRPNSKNRDQSVLDVVNKHKAAGLRITGYVWDTIARTEVAEYSSGDETDGYVVEPGVSSSTKLAVSYPKFTTDYGTKISVKNGVWNGASYNSAALKIIGMPVLKAHSTYRATAAIKKYMGMPSQNLSSRAGGSPHTSVGLGGMGEMMARSRMPVLNILDMTYIGTRGGPGVGYAEASEYFAIAVSSDPFALDYWAVKNVLIPEAKAAGNRNTESMNPDSAEPGSFGYWMNRSLAEVKKAGYNGFIFGADNVVVFEK
jgi:hypothetical protein